MPKATSANFKFEQNYVQIYIGTEFVQENNKDPYAGIAIYFADDNKANVSKKIENPKCKESVEIYALSKALEVANQHGFKKVQIYTTSSFINEQWNTNWKKGFYKNGVAHQIAENKDFRMHHVIITDKELRSLKTFFNNINIKITFFEEDEIPDEPQKIAEKLAHRALRFKY